MDGHHLHCILGDEPATTKLRNSSNAQEMPKSPNSKSPPKGPGCKTKRQREKEKALASKSEREDFEPLLTKKITANPFHVYTKSMILQSLGMLQPKGSNQHVSANGTSRANL